MNNFSELLATDLCLNLVINGQKSTAGLHDELTFDHGDSVTVDGIEILPKYQHLVIGQTLKISQPFYCWYHTVSGQGWLLLPNLT
jgi:hypothetical protein